MKLFLVTLACLCAVALGSFEEDSVRFRDDVAKTDTSKKLKKDIQRQTLTLADEDAKELNKERHEKIKGHGFVKERQDKLNRKDTHKNTLTLNQEQEQDFEKQRKKTFRRTKDFEAKHRSASCSGSHERSRSCSGSFSGSCSSEHKSCGRRCGHKRCNWPYFNNWWGNWNHWGHCGHKCKWQKCCCRMQKKYPTFFKRACKNGFFSMTNNNGKPCICAN